MRNLHRIQLMFPLDDIFHRLYTLLSCIEVNELYSQISMHDDIYCRIVQVMYRMYIVHN
jgi:hypothetical protein